MNRRDTIIVAALVNTGLLLVLFVTAVRGEKKNESSQNIVQLENRIVNLDPITTASSEGPTLMKQFMEPSPIAVNHQLQENSAPGLPVKDGKKSLVIKDEKLIVIENPECKTMQLEQVCVETDKDYVEIVVKKGDFLERIARANHTTVTEIMKVNRLSSTQLKIGQILKVPVRKIGSNESLNDRVVRQNISDAEYYIVKEGDSPWTIALRHKMKLDDLLRLNDLDEYKARYLKPGDQLRVR